MAVLGKANILSADDMQLEEVAVPEWGGSVMVKGLTGKERDAFEDEIVTIRGKETSFNAENFRAKLVVRCIVDEQGKRVFDDRDVAALGNKSAAALQRVFEVAQRLSGLTQNDVEELVKN